MRETSVALCTLDRGQRAVDLTADDDGSLPAYRVVVMRRFDVRWACRVAVQDELMRPLVDAEHPQCLEEGVSKDRISPPLPGSPVSSMRTLVLFRRMDGVELPILIHRESQRMNALGLHQGQDRDGLSMLACRRGPAPSGAPALSSRIKTTRRWV